MRFRHDQHLRRASDIRAVRERGRRLECRAFTIWWRRRDPATVPVPAGGGPRVCVIASTAAVGGATHRNRAKRRLREVFRHRQREAPAGCDMLLIARSAVNVWPISELEQKFSEACRQIPPPAPAASS
ncbi:MAG: ribonuclease P protein component [Opitutus sp.]